MLRFVLIGLSVLLTSCSINPLSGNNSGRSIGKDNFETHITLLPVQSAQLSYGATKNLDVGGLIEYGGLYLSLEAWLKYALINKEQGHGLSLVSGLFSSASVVSSRGFYVGSIYSYRTKNFEPYVKLKLSQVYWDTTSLREEQKKRQQKNNTDNSFINDIIIAVAENADTNFLTYGLGTRINVSDRGAIGLGVLGFASKGVESNLIPEFNFTVKF